MRLLLAFMLAVASIATAQHRLPRKHRADAYVSLADLEKLRGTLLELLKRGELDQLIATGSGLGPRLSPPERDRRHALSVGIQSVIGAARLARDFTVDAGFDQGRLAALCQRLKALLAAGDLEVIVAVGDGLSEQLALGKRRTPDYRWRLELRGLVVRARMAMEFARMTR